MGSLNKYLEGIARKQPVAFIGVLGKVLPLQIEAKGKGNVTINIIKSFDVVGRSQADRAQGRRSRQRQPAVGESLSGTGSRSYSAPVSQGLKGRARAAGRLIAQRGPLGAFSAAHPVFPENPATTPRAVAAS